ncbi:MAG TPA: L-histidine N(alpha)-methyltransferase, partial [Kofleriaceae bacterium]|nr:L-histidine N(alpha)-methyltransferase [Kofleriaceae bacterium]
SLSPLEIEEGSSPVDLQRQFRDRVGYDYLGHRFLYFEPQGSLAWENLIRAGYEQDRWLAGVDDCASTWLTLAREGTGQVRGPIARALGLGRRDRPRGVDIVSLGVGDGSKEVRLLRRLSAKADSRQRPAWITFAPVDVSIALLLDASKAAREALLADAGEFAASHAVLPFCADFEEGPLEFVRRLRTSVPTSADGLRLVLILGNVFGNLRDEERFVRQKLERLVRPGDLLWIEVGLRPNNLEDEPLYALTIRTDREETAAEANRRLLLEGPYRRWAAATGRASPNLDSRVWVREDDDSARIPGSCNFCHDLIIKDERRVVTMLYSRRYKLDALTTWWENLGYAVEGQSRVTDSKGRHRVAHLLLRRR